MVFIRLCLYILSLILMYYYYYYYYGEAIYSEGQIWSIWWITHCFTLKKKETKKNVTSIVYSYILGLGYVSCALIHPLQIETVWCLRFNNNNSNQFNQSEDCFPWNVWFSHFLSSFLTSSPLQTSEREVSVKGVPLQTNPNKISEERRKKALYFWRLFFIYFL